MASTPATNAVGVELQAAGENLNTWGDPKLNNALQILVNLAHGWKAWTINGNYSVSETNYSTTNDTENAFIKLVAGTVAAAFNVTLPGRAKRLFMWNSTSYAATVKLSATTGVTVPAGAFAILATDGTTDVYNVGPTHCGTSTQASENNAYALWGAVQTAIAAASGLTAPFILVSGTDTTAGYLGQKLTVSFSSATTTQLAGLLSAQVDIANLGGNEKSRVLLAPAYVAGYLDGGRKDTAFTADAGYHYNVVSGCTFLMPSAPLHAAKMRIALFNPAANYGINPNGKKINDNTATLSGIPGGQTFELTYDATLGDWE